MSITGFLEIFRRDSRSNKDREIDLFLQADLKQNQLDILADFVNRFPAMHQDEGWIAKKKERKRLVRTAGVAVPLTNIFHEERSINEIKRIIEQRYNGFTLADAKTLFMALKHDIQVFESGKYKQSKKEKNLYDVVLLIPCRIIIKGEMSGAWALATFQTNGCGGYVWGTLSNLKMNSTHHTLAGWKYPRT